MGVGTISGAFNIKYYLFSLSSLGTTVSIFFGRTRFKIIDTINTTATQFSANTFSIILGKMLKISGTCVKPIPILSESAAIVILRCE